MIKTQFRFAMEHMEALRAERSVDREISEGRHMVDPVGRTQHGWVTALARTASRIGSSVHWPRLGPPGTHLPGAHRPAH